MNFAATRSRRHDERRALVLVVVLVVIVALSLGATAFSLLMVGEREVAHAAGRRIQALSLAESGIDAARQLLGEQSDTNTAEDAWFEDSTRFRGVLVLDDEMPRNRGRFSVVATPPNADPGQLRFGLECESAKLNLNTILDGGDDTEARNRLMALPDMTEEIADAILDWIDSDDEQRELGAEAEYYQALDVPYRPANGPIHCLDELLLVRGVTLQHLYGSDRNRNGILDADETGPDAHCGWAPLLTLFSRDGNLNPEKKPKINLNQDDAQTLFTELQEAFGEEWAVFIVGYLQQDQLYDDGGNQSSATNQNGNSGGQSGSTSRQGSSSRQGGNSGNQSRSTNPYDNSGGRSGSNPRQGGNSGNQSPATNPYGSSGGRSGATSRQGGSSGNQPSSTSQSGSSGGQSGSAAQQGGNTGNQSPSTNQHASPGGQSGSTPRQGGNAGNQPPSTNQNSRSGGRSGSTSRQGGNIGTQSPSTSQNGRSTGNSDSNQNQEEEIEYQDRASGQLDLTKPLTQKLDSPLDLIGRKIKVKYQGSEKSTVISPLFANQIEAMREYLPKLLERTTTEEADSFAGRVNVNLAPAPVLEGVPGIDAALAEEIIAHRPAAPSLAAPHQRQPVWLLIDGLVPLEQMKSLLPYLTCGGDVYRVQAVGYFDDGGPTVRLEAIIDALESPPRIVSFKNLTPLGRGFDSATLGAQP